MVNQAPIVRYTASVCEIFFSDFWKKGFSAESFTVPDPIFSVLHSCAPAIQAILSLRNATQHIFSMTRPFRKRFVIMPRGPLRSSTGSPSPDAASRPSQTLAHAGR